VKRPYPSSPKWPANYISFGGPIEWFSISLIVRADDLDPSEITRLFGVTPDETQRKGVPLYRSDGNLKRIPKFGSWTLSLKPSDTDEWDVCEAAKLLLERLPSEMQAWQSLPAGASARMSFGLSLSDFNRGFDLDPELMGLAAARNISFSFDIYCNDDEDDERSPDSTAPPSPGGSTH
jgi:hypothetical protein